MNAKMVINFFGGLVALSGLVWLLQGLSILPGSRMSGQQEWVLYGAIAIVLGGVLLFIANRKQDGEGG